VDKGGDVGDHREFLDLGNDDEELLAVGKDDEKKLVKQENKENGTMDHVLAERE
jgi:hypothetical protein